MRYIICMVGTPGAGKSTFINESSLSNHVLSRDKIKEMFFGTEVENGNLTRRRFSKYKTHKMVNTKKLYSIALRNRMTVGDLIVLDETFWHLDNVKSILSLCSAYQYTPLFIDFDVDLPTALERNNFRKGTVGYVPESVILDMVVGKMEVLNYLNKSGYTVHNRNKFYNGDKVISYLSQQVFDNNMKLCLRINDYEKVYVIGDIQGCYDKLKVFMDEHYNKDNFYIFTGDYTDRGEKNKETLTYLCKLSKANNTQFLMGNHEVYVMSYCAGQESNHKQFNEVTKDEIKSIDKNQLKAFYKRCVDFIHLNRNGKNYIISHGGVNKTFIYEDVVKVPSDYFWYGIGEHEDNTSLTLAKEDAIIIHGHRNNHNNPIRVGNVINLEQKIEFGRELGYYVI